MTAIPRAATVAALAIGAGCAGRVTPRPPPCPTAPVVVTSQDGLVALAACRELPGLTVRSAGPLDLAPLARLVEQVTSSVRWEESIRHLLARGFTRFIELGPGTALTGFMKRIDKNAAVFNVGDAASLAATVTALNNSPAG